MMPYKTCVTRHKDETCLTTHDDWHILPYNSYHTRRRYCTNCHTSCALQHTHYTKNGTSVQQLPKKKHILHTTQQQMHILDTTKDAHTPQNSRHHILLKEWRMPCNTRCHTPHTTHHTPHTTHHTLHMQYTTHHIPHTTHHTLHMQYTTHHTPHTTHCTCNTPHTTYHAMHMQHTTQCTCNTPHTTLQCNNRPRYAHATHHTPRNTLQHQRERLVGKKTERGRNKKGLRDMR